MLRRFLPKQDNFFKLFQKTADLVVSASTEFHTMLHNLDSQQIYVDKIAEYEQTADAITHQTFELLHKTFITPFDREDIHQLTESLDDVLDLINRCAQRFPIYLLKSVPNDMIRLAEISRETSIQLNKAIYRLHSLKNSQEIFECCREIDALESDAHRVVLAGEKELFQDEKEFKQFFKLKEIYAQTKLMINRSQDIANLIKGIVLEYS